MSFDFYFDYVDVDIENLVDLSTTTQQVKKQEMIACLYSCIKGLTEKQQRRLEKYYFQHKTKVSIAKEENVSEGAVRKSIDQSIYQLRRKMYKYIK
ncbi:sigma factor-like helix-turn-helix DNA-binding protein [Sharpea porci]|uniref:sigma factor-like helix-turn-helix DNA-binding protein n=1 Tax=Sharpea porci TaxID=2652286 RepID=UPI002409AB49|nr:sigma factor-like helix-turn-helix DNA-binding protein [Sharpea porci]MDD6712524.1 sigma factor-like helix-turn-helix DNA-binding protein [Sharpea porci]MDY5278576.1 sigma factor-like helix-turn-helix DNA-binding protein [Sharpea porci]